MKRTSIFATLLCMFFAWAAHSQTYIRMTTNQRLDIGQRIEVAGKGFLILQTDGNLVLYKTNISPNSAAWATGTHGKMVTHALMQGDGNLVIYNNSTPIWASNTWNVPNGYFNIDLNNWQIGIYSQFGALMKELKAAENVVTTTYGNIGGSITLTSDLLPFPRQQNWESEMCKALGIDGVASSYASLTPFQQAIGSMGLNAAEAYFAAKNQSNISRQQVIDKLTAEVMYTPFKDSLTGLIAAQVFENLSKNQNDAQSVALRNWAVQVYRQMKVDVAVGTLKEYKTWKANPCTYSAPGYTKPQQCHDVVGNIPYNSMWTTNNPPSDLLLKAGVVYAANNNNQIVNGVAASVAMVGYAAGFGLGTLGIGAVTTAIGPSTTALFYAFNSGTAAAGSAGALGTAGWAGVVAGPAAVIAASVMIGVTQLVAVIEGEQAEWKLKQAIRASMTENLVMANVVADANSGALFMIGLVKSAQNGWKAPTLQIEGEVTFFCEAGYISKFYLSYTHNGQAKSFNTGDLSAGFWKAFTIPAGATNIKVKGVMIAAGEHTIFDQTLPTPTFISYKTYGTVGVRAFNNDWPMSVGGEVSTTSNQIRLWQNAGFVTDIQVDYQEVGKSTRTVHNYNGKTAGWKETLNIPMTATGIHILVKGYTGVAWEPVRIPYELTFPTPPSMCLKIFGTTLDQKWSNECN